MAIGAAIALGLQFAPAIIGLIKGSEEAVGEGNGPKKKDLVIQALRPLFKEFQDRGKIPEEIDLDVLGDIVEGIFKQVKDSGELQERSSENPPGAFATKTAYPARFNFSGPGTIEFIQT